MPLVLSPTTATFSHPSGTTEQNVVSITSTTNNLIKGVWLDLVNLTQNTTIRIQYAIDGMNYRTAQSIDWTTGMDDGVFIDGNFPINRGFRVTLQSSTAEGASRNVPYQYWIEGVGTPTAFTYTLTDTANNQPIPDAEVWVTTDVAGNNIVASGTTNASGQVVFYLSSATYQVWRRKSGWNFSNPDSESV